MNQKEATVNWLEAMYGLAIVIVHDFGYVSKNIVLLYGVTRKENNYFTEEYFYKKEIRDKKKKNKTVIFCKKGTSCIRKEM